MKLSFLCFFSSNGRASAGMSASGDRPSAAHTSRRAESAEGVERTLGAVGKVASAGGGSGTRGSRTRSCVRPRFSTPHSSSTTSPVPRPPASHPSRRAPVSGSARYESESGMRNLPRSV
eukprot:scaffold10056_cov93-Isochrysis_galbana.AAC.2